MVREKKENWIWRKRREKREGYFGNFFQKNCGVDCWDVKDGDVLMCEVMC